MACDTATVLVRSFTCDEEAGSDETRGMALIVPAGPRALPDFVIVLTDVVCLVSGFDTSVGVGIVTFVTGLFRLDTLRRLLRFGLPSSS